MRATLLAPLQRTGQLSELLVTLCLWFKSTRVDIGAMCYLHVFHVLIDIKCRLKLPLSLAFFMRLLFLSTSTKILLGDYVATELNVDSYCLWKTYRFSTLWPPNKKCIFLLCACCVCIQLGVAAIILLIKLMCYNYTHAYGISIYITYQRYK